MNKLFKLLPLLAALPVVGVAAEKPATLQPKTALTTRQCAVHHQVLKTDWVKIQYGLIRQSEEYVKARQKEFPNSNKVAYGGCVISVATDGKHTVRSPQFEKVDYCAKCRSAEEYWRKAHPKAH